MTRTLITNGTVVSPSGRSAYDVLIAGEVLAARCRAAFARPHV